MEKIADHVAPFPGVLCLSLHTKIHLVVYGLGQNIPKRMDLNSPLGSFFRSLKMIIVNPLDQRTTIPHTITIGQPVKEQ